MPNEIKEPLELFFTQIKSSYNFWFNNLKGFNDESIKNRFILLNFLQLYILWILQLKGLFNNDMNYIKNKFNENKAEEGKFSFFQHFLLRLLKIISSETEKSGSNNLIFGKIIKTKIISLFDDLCSFSNIHVPNNFYYSSEISGSQNMDFFPVLNAFESLNSINPIDYPFILGSLYENFLFFSTKRKSGIYYTPKELCQYLSRYTIEKWLINELKKNMNISSNDIFKIIDGINTVSDLGKFFDILQHLKVLDPTAGTGNFLESSLIFLIEIYLSLRRKIAAINSANVPIFYYYELDEYGDLKQIILDGSTSLNHFKFKIITKLICPNNLFGVELDPIAVKIIKLRLFLSAINTIEKEFDFDAYNFDIIFDNIKEGNSILGLVSNVFNFKILDQISEKKHLFPLEENIQISKSLQVYLLHAIQSVEHIIPSDNCHLIQKLKSYDKLIILRNFKELYTLSNILKKIWLLSGKNLVFRELDHLLESLNTRISDSFTSLYNNSKNVPDYYFRQLFHWPLRYPLILNFSKGFSVILCNPPYKGESGNKEFFRVLSRVFPNYYEGKMDLWYLFVHRAIDLLQENGYMTFLTSNYWITASGGKTLRERIFRETEIDKYINFGDNSVFNSALGIHVNSFTLKKTQKEDILIKCTQFTK
ncbi:Eco57I restriction-modification methylase domain-containing protein, partial [Candidatus Hodarchaeum mangrovi]